MQEGQASLNYYEMQVAAFSYQECPSIFYG